MPSGYGTGDYVTFRLNKRDGVSVYYVLGDSYSSINAQYGEL